MADLLYLMAFFDGRQELGLNPPVEFEKALHLTVLPSFGVKDHQLNAFVAGLDRVTRFFPQIELVSGKPDDFGTLGSPYPVLRVLDRAGVIPDLHFTMLDLVAKHQGRFEDRRFIGKNYSPHVSHCGDVTGAYLTHLTLVHHTEGFNKRVVTLANFSLAKS